MTAHTCADCRHPIPHGLAVMRSRSFRLVALCRECGPGPNSPRGGGELPRVSGVDNHTKERIVTPVRYRNDTERGVD
jgi:RNase P subunit RPR2